MTNWTDIQDRFIELLYWMRDQGLTPHQPRHQDVLLNPFTRRTSTHRQMTPHQRRYSLWVPTHQGMKNRLPNLRMEYACGMHIASAGEHVGAGPGESEALLSLAHSMRRELQAAA